MTPKLFNLNIVLGYWNENMNQNFRFNNPKQCSNWIILVSCCSSHLAIKIAIMFILWKFKKIDVKIDFSAKNSKKFVYYNEELVINSKFQTQLSRKLQRFRTCCKNKKCSIFHDLSEYIIFSYDCKLLDWSFKMFVSCKNFHTFSWGSSSKINVHFWNIYSVEWISKTKFLPR
jgi:hypothetical protein